MLDANFRLKSKQRNLDDAPLGGGVAYYVENKEYMSHVKACGAQTEVHFHRTGSTDSSILTRTCFRLMFAIPDSTLSTTPIHEEAALTLQAALGRVSVDICW